ncbi:acetyltransferase [Hutsoniella sourekii]|uniref:acetyltransferase n=1 Tax=Hutsoniella sourekii TaxID=87650 RepID=UPI0004BADEE9|nr:acetyltransferase [Hutsoniella sourekii]
MSSLYIIGAGGHGKVVAEAAQLMNKWSQIYFLDDREELWGTIINDCKVIGSLEDVLKKEIVDSEWIVAIGDNRTREKIQSKLEKAGCQIATIIHPSAIISKYSLIGEGTVVIAGAVVNASTIIGRGCIVNSNVSIDHDNKIGDFVHLSPGVTLGGTVEIGDRSWLGLVSVVKNNVNIAEDCIIGAQGLVLKNLTLSSTYIGQPVRALKGSEV